MASFRVARPSEYLAITGWGIDDVKLAKKAWVWLGVQRCETLDASPTSHELDAQAITSECFPIFLHAVYTVGLKIDASTKKKPGKDDPLLLYAKLVNSQKQDASSKSHVIKQLVQSVLQGHVAELAAGTAAEQIFVHGAGSFVKEVHDRVQRSLGKFGIHVYHANVTRVQIQVPTNKYLALVGKKEQELGAAYKVAGGFAVEVTMGDRETTEDKVLQNKTEAEKLWSGKAAMANNAQVLQVQEFWEHILANEALHMSMYKNTAAAAAAEEEEVLLFEQMKADVDRYFKQDVPKMLTAAMGNARKAVAVHLAGESSATRRRADRFFEKHAPRMLSMVVDTARRAFAVFTAIDDETGAEQQKAATEGMGNAN